MAVIFKPMTFGSTGRERQHRIESIQSLDSGLLINAEYRRVLRRFDVQPDDVGCLGFKVGIVGYHIAFQPVRFQARSLPDPRYHHVTGPDMFRQLAATPMRRTIWWLLACTRQNSRLQFRRSLFRLSTTVTRMQSSQSMLQESPLPRTDVAAVATQSLANGTERLT